MVKRKLFRKGDARRIEKNLKSFNQSTKELARQSMVFAKGTKQLTRQGITSVKSRAKRAKQVRGVKDRIKTFLKGSIY